MSTTWKMSLHAPKRVVQAALLAHDEIDDWDYELVIAGREEAEDLLKHKLFKQCSKAALMTQLLCYVEPVGSDYVEGDELVFLEAIDNTPIGSKHTLESAPPVQEGLNCKRQEVTHSYVASESDHSGLSRTDVKAHASSRGQEQVNSALSAPAASNSNNNAYVPGTSWVFEEDEPVLSAAPPLTTIAEDMERSNKDSQKESLDDFLKDFESSI